MEDVEALEDRLGHVDKEIEKAPLEGGSEGGMSRERTQVTKIEALKENLFRLVCADTDGLKILRD